MLAMAAPGEKVVAINLFGIRHAEWLRRLPLVEVAQRAGIPASYLAEINRGIALSRVVMPRDSAPRIIDAFAFVARRAPVKMPTIN